VQLPAPAGPDPPCITTTGIFTAADAGNDDDDEDGEMETE